MSFSLICASLLWVRGCRLWSLAMSNVKFHCFRQRTCKTFSFKSLYWSHLRRRQACQLTNWPPRYWISRRERPTSNSWTYLILACHSTTLANRFLCLTLTDWNLLCACRANSFFSRRWSEAKNNTLSRWSNCTSILLRCVESFLPWPSICPNWRASPNCIRVLKKINFSRSMSSLATMNSLRKKVKNVWTSVNYWGREPTDWHISWRRRILRSHR